MEIHLRRKQDDENKKREKESQAKAKASGSEVARRESTVGSLLSRMGSRSSKLLVLERRDTAALSRRSQAPGGSAAMTEGNENGHGGEGSGVASPSSPDDGFELRVMTSDGSSNGGQVQSSHLGPGGPRESRLSGLTTLAATSTTDQSGSSGAGAGGSLRGGGDGGRGRVRGRDGLWFWDRSFEDRSFEDMV